MSKDEAVWAEVECAGKVRWKGGKLQQLFILHRHTDNTPTGINWEWREVPAVADDAPDQEVVEQ